MRARARRVIECRWLGKLPGPVPPATIEPLSESGPIELYCTYFDHNYLRKALLMYLSLRRHSRPQRAVLVVLALSERCEQILARLALPDLMVIPLAQAEAHEPRLLVAKANRRTVEYFFTLTPWLIELALEACPEAQRATYLDSDLYFYSSPQPLWLEIGDAPMAFVEHRFAPGYTDKVIFGRFNVGWNTFDRTPHASSALRWWGERCLEWCYDRVEGEKFADQGYLTTLERQFGGVHALRYPGVNLAQYNLANYQLSLRANRPWADGLPVIYWHMHSTREQPDGQIQVPLGPDTAHDPVVNWAYQHYIERLQTLTARLQRLGLPIDRGSARYANA